MRKDGFEFSIFWNPCEKILWENPTVQPPQHQGGTSIWGHQRPLRPLCLPMKRPVELWGFTTVGSTVTVCEISPLRQITMDLMFWRMIIKQWPPMQRLKYTQNSSSITLSLGKWVRDIWGQLLENQLKIQWFHNHHKNHVFLLFFWGFFLMWFFPPPKIDVYCYLVSA